MWSPLKYVKNGAAVLLLDEAPTCTVQNYKLQCKNMVPKIEKKKKKKRAGSGNVII